MKPLLAAALGAATLLSAVAAQAQPAAPATAPAAAPVAVKAPPPATMVGPALYVSDMDKTLAFYTNGMGMTVRMRFGTKEEPQVIVGYGADMHMPGLMLLGSPKGAKIEHGHGYDRVAFNVLDLKGLQTKLRAAGYPAPEIGKAHGIVQIMMVTDPDGYKLELLQPPPGM